MTEEIIKHQEEMRQLSYERGMLDFKWRTYDIIFEEMKHSQDLEKLHYLKELWNKIDKR